MRLEDIVGYLLILLGVGIAIAGVLDKGLAWIVGGIVLAWVGALLVRAGRRRYGDDIGEDISDAMLDSLDD